MVLARVPLATKNAASSRRSGVSQGAARKTAREKIKKGGERKQKQRVLSLPLAVRAIFYFFASSFSRWALTNWTPGEATIKRRRRLRVHTYITFISPRIYKSSCIANFSESWWAMIHLNFVSLTLGETLCDDEAEWISWPNLILSFPVLSIDHEIKRSTACEPKKKLKLGIRSLSRLSK